MAHTCIRGASGKVQGQAVKASGLLRRGLLCRCCGGRLRRHLRRGGSGGRGRADHRAVSAGPREECQQAEQGGGGKRQKPAIGTAGMGSVVRRMGVRVNVVAIIGGHGNSSVAWPTSPRAVQSAPPHDGGVAAGIGQFRRKQKGRVRGPAFVCFPASERENYFSSAAFSAASWSTLARGALPSSSSLACWTHSSRSIRPPSDSLAS